MLDFGESLRLVEAIADNERSGLGLQGRVAFDPLGAIDVEYIDRTPVAYIQVFVTWHLRADEPVVLGVTREIGAVAIRDGKRGSLRNTLLRDVVREPIEAETRHDETARAAIVAIKRQRKLNDLDAGCQTCRIF